MKTCSKCKEVKPLDVFSKCAAFRDGRASVCKACNKSSAKAWYEANKARSREKSVAWRLAHPGYQEAKSKAWYEKHKDILSERNRQKTLARHAANPHSARAHTDAWKSCHPDVSTREEWSAQVKARYLAANPDYGKNKSREHRAKLSPSYVAHLLGLPAEVIPPELLELKRQQIEIKRLSKQLKSAINQSKDTQ